jgi:hypothetical protein
MGHWTSEAAYLILGYLAHQGERQDDGAPWNVREQTHQGESQ